MRVLLHYILLHIMGNTVALNRCSKKGQIVICGGAVLTAVADKNGIAAVGLVGGEMERYAIALPGTGHVPTTPTPSHIITKHTTMNPLSRQPLILVITLHHIIPNHAKPHCTRKHTQPTSNHR